MTPEQIDAAEGAAVSVVLTPEERYLLHEAALAVVLDLEQSFNDDGERRYFDASPVALTDRDVNEYGEWALVRIEAALVVAFERGKAAHSCR